MRGPTPHPLAALAGLSQRRGKGALHLSLGRGRNSVLGISCEGFSSRPHRQTFNFQRRAEGEAIDAEGGARRFLLREELHICRVHLGELRHVVEKDRAFDDVVERRAEPRERQFVVLENRFRLRPDAAFDQFDGSRLPADFAREIDGVADDDRRRERQIVRERGITIEDARRCSAEHAARTNNKTAPAKPLPSIMARSRFVMIDPNALGYRRCDTRRLYVPNRSFVEIGAMPLQTRKASLLLL